MTTKFPNRMLEDHSDRMTNSFEIRISNSNPNPKALLSGCPAEICSIDEKPVEVHRTRLASSNHITKSN